MSEHMPPNLGITDHDFSASDQEIDSKATHHTSKTPQHYSSTTTFQRVIKTGYINFSCATMRQEGP
jgi:hypothetical protein